jgi:hypothetical protein
LKRPHLALVELPVRQTLEDSATRLTVPIPQQTAVEKVEGVKLSGPQRLNQQL